MRSAVDQLNPKDIKTLALFYDTESYRALRRLVDIERLELAKDHVNNIDIMQIRYLSGQVEALKKLIETIHSIYKLSNEGKKAKVTAKEV